MSRSPKTGPSVLLDSGGGINSVFSDVLSWFGVYLFLVLVKSDVA